MLRVEDLDASLEHGVENPQAVLETLVNAAAKGHVYPALFEKLHAVAGREDKLADLAFAYESLSQDRRLKLLSADNHAAVLMQAVAFFADLFGDPDGAATYAERVLTLVPGHADAVARLEGIYAAAPDRGKLAKFYLDLAAVEREPAAQLGRLRAAAGIAVAEPSLRDLAIEALTRVSKLDPADVEAREALETRLVEAGKPREAVKVLEQALARTPAPVDLEAFQIRTRLLDLYRDLGEPHRAVPHIEALLAVTPEHGSARAAAEALLDNKAVAARVAAALSDAYHKLGMREQASAMLNFELKVVRGPRRMEVQRRLAFIRHDSGDPAGALELLAPVVSAEPGEDEARRRFVELSLSLNQPAEAARLLSRALGACKDPAVRARVGAEIGTVYLRSGDVKRAEAAFKQVIESGDDPSATLVAARELAELSEKAGDLKALSSALELVVQNETDAEKRSACARRLARLCETELNEPGRAVSAWRALVDSPWADEALRKLTALYEEQGNWDGLVEVTERRSQRAKDVGEARHLSYRAAELRSEKSRDKAAALGAWRAYLARFGPSREAHAQMIPLLEQEKQWKELAWVVEREIELAPLPEWVGLLNRLAQLRLSRLDDEAGALAAYRKALETDPADKVSRAAVEKLLGAGSVRLEAADVLEGVYRDEEPGAGLMRVLETRAELATDPAARLTAIEEAIGIADRALKDPARALQLAGRGLGYVLDQAPGQIPAWLARVQAHAAEAGQPQTKVAVLSGALGDRAVDSPELSALAQAAGEALVAVGDVAHAVAVYRRALEFEPSSPELLNRVDELLAEQGSPGERLALYRSALARGPEPARRRSLLHSMARLQQKELADPRAAIDSWRQALADDDKDAAAHQALVQIYSDQREHAPLYTELERALALHEGERRNATLLRMAEVATELGDATRALDHYRELLGSAELSDVVLENIELLAHANNDADTMRNVLERRIAVAAAPEDRAALLEKLGLVQAKQLADGASAAKSWMQAARLADAAGDDDRSRRLYERVLGVSADESEAARRLIELYAAAGAWQRVPEAFSVLGRSGADERDLVALLLSLEPPAVQAGAVDVYLELSEAVLGRPGLDPARMRSVLLARARVLATGGEHRDEVAEIYRRVLEMGGDDVQPVADAFNMFLAASELTPARIADRRWLFEWRASRASDPTTVLIAWAVAEETTLGNAAAAVELYQRVLDRDPERLDALHQLARLQSTHGDPDGALRTLQALRERSEGEQRTHVELGIAALLLERVGRPLDAMGTLESLLDASPGDPEVLRLVRVALGFPEARAQAAVLLERVAHAAETPAARAEVLQSLLDVSEGLTELADARSRWFHELLEAKEDDPEAALKIALRGAEERPEEASLWDAAERLARRANLPEPLAEAYRHALDTQLSPELAEELGRRMVELTEEWFEDPERVVALLGRVLELCPTADWAFDRLKLAFNAQARWPELFTLYDAAIAREKDERRRADLLREAAMAAKDFANDPERAIDYLERLEQMAPGDARIDAALERLYEREGRVRPLIDLLDRRLAGAASHAKDELRARIASLWLDLGEAIDAFKLLEELAGRDPVNGQVYQLLERLVRLPAARESIAPTSAASKKKKKAKSVRHAAAEILRQRYESSGNQSDVARMLEVELELTDDPAERVKRLGQIIELKLGDLGDLPGAFESTAQLVALEPGVAAHRDKLAQLAALTGAQSRRADLLVGIGSGCKDRGVGIRLVAEAAVVRQELGDAPGAIELHSRVLEEAGSDTALCLESARELDGLLERLGRVEERCTVLERLAELEGDVERRCAALGTAANLAGRGLGDWERALGDWRRRLALRPEDPEALDGVCEALTAAERWADAIPALEARIACAASPDDARRDRIAIARLWAERLGDPDRAITAWHAVREQHGRERDAFEALRDLLVQASRWPELAALIDDEAGHETDGSRERSLRVTLGEVHRSHTGDLGAALGAFVAAEDWPRAVEVVGLPTDRPLAQQLARQLLELASAAWKALESPEQQVDSGPARAAVWAVELRGARLSEEGKHAEVVDLLMEAAALPFPVGKRRAMLSDAGCLCSDRLSDPGRAIQIFRELFAADPADEVARGVVTRFALLLEEQTLHGELAALWEQQAQCRAAGGDTGAAAALWARAAEIAENRLQDLERALADHRQGAALGGQTSLEALARIHESRCQWRDAAAVLEWLCAQSARDELGARALRLAEAYVAAGQPERARARLEHAAQTALEAGPVRQRLAGLYRAQQDWAPLAELLASDAARAPDVKSRLRLLQEIAELHLQKRNDPGAAVPVLEQAIDLAPDEPSLRRLLADSLMRAERFDDATAVLRQQVERYGTRKPKERALVHFQLAKVSLAAGHRAEAIAELDLANKIDPAHAGILQALARLAFEEGQLDRAEKQYRALLLVLGRDQDPEAPSRAEALLDLAEIAARGEDQERAAEFVESAFEAALESEREAEALERTLGQRGRYEQLARAVEARLARASSPVQAATALADLAFLHAEHLGGLGAMAPRLKDRAASIHKSMELEGVSEDPAWAALGRVYDWLGDASAEADVLERRVMSLTASPGGQLDVDPFYRLAEVRLRDRAARERGVAVLERALELSPDLGRAERLLRQTLQDDPTAEPVVRLFERVARASGNDRMLGEALGLVVRLPGVHVEALREGVELARRTEDPALARSLLESALADTATDLPAEEAGWARRELATVLEAAGELPRALALLEEAAALLPPDQARPMLLTVAARASNELQDHERSARIYQALREQDPADREVWEPLFEVYRKLDASDRLIELIEQTVPLVDSLTDRARLRLEQATILLDEDKTEAGTTILKEVLVEDPGQQRAADLLMKILEAAGRQDELSSLLVTQIDAAKDRQDTAGIVAHSLRLGAMLEAAGRREDAYDVYVAVLDWDKSDARVLDAVLRLAELRDDPVVVADALEGLLRIERGDRALELASRLVELRTEQGDEEGAQRALELGFVASPTTLELREPLLERYAEREDWAGAGRVLREAVRVAPSDRELLERLVGAHRNAGEQSEALEVLDAIVAESGSDLELCRARAALLADLGRDDDAVRALEEAFEQSPEVAPELIDVLERATLRAEPDRERELTLRLIEVLEQSGNGDGARARLADLIKTSPKDKQAILRLGELEVRAERWDAASTAWRKLIALQEGDELAQTALALADACEMAGRFGDARGGLERALKAVPSDARIRTKLRALYETVGDNRQLAQFALEDAAAAQDVGERLGHLLEAGALLLMPDGSPEDAVRVLEEARGLSPESNAGIVLMARAWAAVGRGVEAMTLLNDAAAAHRGRRSRELSNIHREMSRLQLGEGLLSEALASLTRAFEMDMRNARLAMELGQLALDMDESEVAGRAFRAVTMLRPGDEDGTEAATPGLRAHAQYQLALMAQRSGDARRAKALAGKALSENPDHELAKQLVAELDARA